MLWTSSDQGPLAGHGRRCVDGFFSPEAGSPWTTPGAFLTCSRKRRKRLSGNPQLIHYMAVPPSAFGPLSEAIGAHGLAEGS